MTRDDLIDAIRWMCTEMPVNWADMAIGEGRADVVETVRQVVDMEAMGKRHE
jgi:hypothetical protein